MTARIEAFNWASTPLGPPERWPDELRIALSIAEHSAFPTAIYWGPDFHLLYNDAWAPIPGERHPWAFGRPAQEVWGDIWSIVGPQFQEVLTSVRGLSRYEQMLPMMRGGTEQETYWTYSLTPITDAAGKVLGIFNQGNEVTKTVVSERRLSFQIAVADRLRSLSKPEEVWTAAAALLGEYLGAARVGFAEVDEDADRLSAIREWQRDSSVPSLQGRSGKLSGLSQLALTYLRAGEVLIIPDLETIDPAGRNERMQLDVELGARSLLTVPLRHNDRLMGLLYVHDLEPRPWKRSEAAMARDVAERSWAAVERAESEERLRESEDHYRHTVELTPHVTWTALPDGQLNRVSRRWFDWTGTTGLGESWAEGLHSDDVERSFQAWGRSIATGEPYDIEQRLKMLDGGYRWARSRAFPRRDADRQICLWYGSTEDIHERKLGEERQRLLINELNHRVKNTLATVQAIAFQTLKGDVPLAEARSRFEARLLALSRAHNLLTEQHWEGASLERVVADSTAYLGEDRQRFQVEGERVFLAPRAALAIALALHELGTNALKHGALAADRGRVTIRWHLADDGLRLDWKESDGPAVAEPTGRGFGSRLIERGLQADLGGGAELLFEPDGLHCVIHASLAAIQEQEPLLV